MLPTPTPLPPTRKMLTRKEPRASSIIQVLGCRRDWDASSLDQQDHYRLSLLRHTSSEAREPFFLLQ